MSRRMRGGGIGLVAFLSGVLLASSAWAETIEFVTYFPTQANAGDVEMSSLTVGNAANMGGGARTSAPGEALIEDRLAIGTTETGANGEDVVRVAGRRDEVSTVLFLPGPDTAAGPTSDIRLGIGWPSPETALHVQKFLGSGSTIAELPILLHNNSTATLNRRTGLALRNEDSNSNPIYSAIYTEKDTADTVQMHFDVGTNAGLPGNLNFSGNEDDLTRSGTTDTVMTLNSAGRVGIGTVAPEGALHVAGGDAYFKVGSGSRSNTDLFVDSNGAETFSGVVFRNDAGINQGWIRYSEDNGYVAISDDARNEHLVVNGGNVGIGTTTPTSAPSPGNGAARGNLDVNDIWIRSANGGAGGWASAGGSLGTRVFFEPNTVRQAPTDGFVVASSLHIGMDNSIAIYAGPNNPPTQVVAHVTGGDVSSQMWISTMAPVRSGEFYKVSMNNPARRILYFIPLD